MAIRAAQAGGTGTRKQASRATVFMYRPIRLRPRPLPGDHVPGTRPRPRGRGRLEGHRAGQPGRARENVNTAAALGQFTVTQLIGLAQPLDPGLTDRDFADVGRQLDRMPDGLFACYGLSPADVATVRGRFGDWPRDA